MTNEAAATARWNPLDGRLSHWKRLRWLWSAAVIAASISPRAIKVHLHTVGALHTFSHISVFALGAILMCHSRSGDRPSVRSVLWLSGLAIASEILEAAVYGNRMEWNDVSSDMAGLLLGLGVLYLLHIAFLKVKVNSYEFDNR